MAKPAGLMVVLPESTESFLGGLGVTSLYGVGPKTAKTLESMGIRTIAELARTDIDRLEDSFGRKLATYLRDAANGTDTEPVKENQAPTQFSRIITLKNDTTDPEEVMNELVAAHEELGKRLALQNVSFRTLSAITILTDLSTKTKSKTFETPVNDLAAMKNTLLELFSQLSETTDREFRRVGIRVSDLSTNQDQKSIADFLQPP